METKKCPFFESVMMSFCKAYPIKKMIPAEKLQSSSPCALESHNECPVYKEFTASIKAEKIKGFLWRKDLYYHQGHTWVKPEGKHIKIGLDDFASRLLSGINALQMPSVGEELASNRVGWSFILGNRSAEILSPVTCNVSRVNPDVIKEPSIINDDPYGYGWLFEAVSKNGDGFKKLLSGDLAKNWLEWEINRLHTIMEMETGTTVTDGGVLVPDLHKILDENQWKRLISLFLLT